MGNFCTPPQEPVDYPKPRPTTSFSGQTVLISENSNIIIQSSRSQSVSQKIILQE
jgi:hypothetical protein